MKPTHLLVPVSLVLTIALVIWIVGYLWIAQPDPGAWESLTMEGTRVEVLQSPMYRFAPGYAGVLYAPLVSIDRKLRHDHWTHTR